ncbi:MAG: hypothetical protein CSA75_00350 [Sorangium cellulosum]|nr:MAG: hypothetical protein CSA75_00350 [Sorangium cellulosum]
MSEEQKESSVLFSLNELFSLEQERIKQEEEAKIQAADAARRAEDEAKRAAIEAEERRIREEEERKRAEEQRKREEAARLEALRQAEVEKARVAAEEQARLEAMRQNQAHAQELAKIKQDKSKKNLTIMIAVGVVLFIAVSGIGGGLWYSSWKDQQEIAKANAIKEAEYKKAQEELEKKLGAQQAKVADLLKKLSSAEDEATKAKLRAELADAQKAATRTQGAINTGRRGSKRSGGNATPKPACTCVEGDPMCSCL